MATYTQLPGTLNLSFRRGDSVSAEVDFSVGLSGYTASASVVSLVTGSAVASPGVAITDAANGIANVTLTGTQTGAMASGTYGWSLWWDAPGVVRRTVLSGFVEVVS